MFDNQDNHVQLHYLYEHPTHIKAGIPNKMSPKTCHFHIMSGI